MAGRVVRHALAALGLTAMAAGAWAAGSPDLAMRFEVIGMRLVLPALPEAGSRPPAQFYARSATGTMADALVVFASDVTGSARLQMQPDLAAQDTTLSSHSALVGQPAGTIVFPEGLRVQWASGELTATHASVHDSIIELTQPRIRSDRLLLRAGHGIVQVRPSPDASATSAGAMDASFTTDVQVVLR